jgi:hypothetical protein
MLGGLPPLRAAVARAQPLPQTPAAAAAAAHVAPRRAQAATAEGGARGALDTTRPARRAWPFAASVD